LGWREAPGYKSGWINISVGLGLPTLLNLELSRSQAEPLLLRRLSLPVRPNAVPKISQECSAMQINKFNSYFCKTQWFTSKWETGEWSYRSCLNVV